LFVHGHDHAVLGDNGGLYENTSSNFR
jgi:hypothetical protein